MSRSPPRRRDLRMRPVDEDPTKVFVGGINFSTKSDVLEEHFSKFGKLRKAEVRVAGAVGGPARRAARRSRWRGCRKKQCR